jgi:hypothetical protein
MGHITADAMWTGAVKVSGITTIDPGVTVTVAEGTTITVLPVANFAVQGTLDFQGTSAGKIKIDPETAGGHYGPISVMTGGTLKMADNPGDQMGKRRVRRSKIGHVHGAARAQHTVDLVQGMLLLRGRQMVQHQA